jgi:hypothetical protein
MTLLDGREGNHNQMEQIDENLEDTRYKLDENFLQSRADVSEAIKQLKNNRAPGPDNLNAELIKVAEPTILERVYHIIIQTWKTEIYPRNGKKALFVQYIRKETLLNVRITEDSLYLTQFIRYSRSYYLKKYNHMQKNRLAITNVGLKRGNLLLTKYTH